MDHVADQDEPVGSNSRRWNFPRSGSGLKTDTPFNIQEFWKLSAGVHTHDGKEGMMDEEMSEGDPEESYAAIWSAVTVPTAAAGEARENPKVDELWKRLVKDYPRFFFAVWPTKINLTAVDLVLHGKNCTPNPKVYRHREHQLQCEGAGAMENLLEEFIERGSIEPTEKEWASPAFIVLKKEKGDTFDFTGHKVAKTRILSKWLTKLTHLCCVFSLF